MDGVHAGGGETEHEKRRWTVRLPTGKHPIARVENEGLRLMAASQNTNHIYLKTLQCLIHKIPNERATTSKTMKR